MTTEYYTVSGSPSTGAAGSSATMRSEFSAIEAGFAKLPTMLGSGDLPVFVNAGGTALTTVSASSARTKLGLAIGSNVQAWDADLDALAALDATVGLLIKTAAATYTRRDLIGTANEITVTNGNGVAGNLTVSLPSALTFTGKTVTGGTFNNATHNGGTVNNATVTNLVSPLLVGSGGTGLNSLTQNAIVVGNAAGAVTSVAPGTANNVLISNGSAWVSGLDPNAVAPAPVNNSIGGDVTVNNTSVYFDGPSIAQGSTGTWWVSGYVTVLDTAGGANFSAKLWDGTNVVASAQGGTVSPTEATVIALSGFITSPAGNLRISVRDITTTSGFIKANLSGNSKDSMISAMRIS